MRESYFIRQIGHSFLLFLILICLFLYLIGKTEKQNVQEQKKYLESAIEQSMMQCFITRGRYPESFLYLEENYGIVYDKKRFRVDYQVFGTNIRPKITIILLGEKNESTKKRS